MHEPLQSTLHTGAPSHLTTLFSPTLTSQTCATYWHAIRQLAPQVASQLVAPWHAALQLSPQVRPQAPFPCAQSNAQRGAVPGQACVQLAPLGQKQTSGPAEATLHPLSSQPATAKVNVNVNVNVRIREMASTGANRAGTIIPKRYHSLRSRKEAGYLEACSGS